MKIDLKKLGLPENATLEQIQTAIDGLGEIFSVEEKDAAAAAARTAAEAKTKEKLKASTLSDEELKEFQTYKKQNKLDTLNKNETLMRFKDEDRKLIIQAKGLENLEGEELDKAIEQVSKDYANRMSNKLPPKITEEKIDDKVDEELTHPSGIDYDDLY